MKGIRARYNLSILVLLAGLAFHSCAGIYSVVEFEVLEPATVSFPDHVKQLIILNRAPVTFDAFQEDDRRGMTEKQLQLLDTMIVNSHNHGLRKILQQSPIERFRHPIWSNARRRDTTGLEDLILTKREVDDICRENLGDAILSLEFYSMDIDMKTIYYEDEPSVVSTRYYEISNHVLWNIYLQGSPKPFDSYTLSDTLFFTEISNGQFVDFVTPPEMIRETFEMSGMKYGRYLVPVWVKASRVIFKGKHDSLRLASKHTGMGDWDKAYEIWTSLSTGGDSTLMARAMHNMAIYHELEDNLDSASILVNMALELDTLETIRVYKEELDTRVLNKQELIEQVR